MSWTLRRGLCLAAAPWLAIGGPVPAQADPLTFDVSVFLASPTVFEFRGDDCAGVVLPRDRARAIPDRLVRGEFPRFPRQHPLHPQLQRPQLPGRYPRDADLHSLDPGLVQLTTGAGYLQPGYCTPLSPSPFFPENGVLSAGV